MANTSLAEHLDTIRQSNPERFIGSYTSNKPGPLLIALGAVHGNEPSGVQALERVFKSLEQKYPQINGAVIGLYGNKPALEQDKRFIDQDLNRIWTPENIELFRKGERGETVEQNELFEISAIIDQLKELFERQPVYYVDCHTTSAESLPFISVRNLKRNIEFSAKYPVHQVLGFTSIVGGTTGDYFVREGFTGFAFEAGQHYAPVAVDNHEALLWLVMQHCDFLNGDLDSEYLIGFEAHLKSLVPLGHKNFDITYLHKVKPEDEFEMKPGYVSFQPIEKGEVLGKDKNGEVLSPKSGEIFMPLYQKNVEDGFFIIEEVGDFLEYLGEDQLL